MNSPKTADRGQVSSIIDDIIGRPGLFTSRGELHNTTKLFMTHTRIYRSHN